MKCRLNKIVKIRLEIFYGYLGFMLIGTLVKYENLI